MVGVLSFPGTILRRSHIAFRVLCLSCGEQTPRRVLQERFQVLNPSWSAEAQDVAPDGDVFLTEEQVRSFQVPSCDRCGGPLKPDVVFFGDTVNPDKVDFVHRRVKEADSLLVVGSSLQVPDSVRVAVAHARFIGCEVLEVCSYLGFPFSLRV